MSEAGADNPEVASRQLAFLASLPSLTIHEKTLTLELYTKVWIVLASKAKSGVYMG